MPMALTEKQKLLLMTLAKASAVYLVFQYLIPLVLPFLVAALLALLIRPVVECLQERFRLPRGIGAGLVLALVLAGLGVGIYFLGKTIAEQLVRLGQNLPQLWQQGYDKLWQMFHQAENHLQMEPGALTGQIHSLAPKGESTKDGMGMVGETWAQRGSQSIGQWIWEMLVSQFSSLLGTSLQGVVAVGKMLFTLLVTLFVTVGATLITTTQLEDLTLAMDRSLFRREIRGILQTLARVGKAYGKTQLVIMGCTVIVCGIGLTLLGDPYALLWALVIGVVDALPLFGAGIVLWPWMLFSALQGRFLWTVSLAVMYAVTNLTRQWLEARYMGDRIGLSALENLLAMYVGLQLFGILGLFLGPIGYLLIKESAPLETEERTRSKSQ